MRTIFDEYKDLKQDYESTSIQIVSGLTFSQYQTIRMVEFYTNSKYLSGPTDSLGRVKPFYNIVNANVDVAVVATDIDRKDIDVTSDNPGEYTKSFILRRLVYNWMGEADFGVTLNDMGDTRARYGGVLVKKCIYKEDGKDEMKIDVVKWKNVITSQNDILNNPILEEFYMSAWELSQKDKVWDNVPEAMKMFRNKSGKYTDIKIVDIYGAFPKSIFEGDYREGDIDYTLQHHIIAVKNNGKYVSLFKEEIDEIPYKYCAWKQVAGRDLGRGVVEDGEEAQVWTNDAAIGEKNAFELGSKVFFKTNSQKIGNNVLTDANNGTIFKLEGQTDINVVNTITNALPEFQNLIEKWGKQYDRASAITDALRGETPPSGQPYRLQALVTQQSASQFDYRREEMGLFLEEIFEDWVLPYITKKFNKQFILSSNLFSETELKKIDENFATENANNDFVDKFIANLNAGDKVTTLDQQSYDTMKNDYSSKIKQTGKQRFLEVPKDYFKDIECRVTINTTGEQRNKMAILESLSNIINTVSANPAILQDETLRTIFNRILELSGSGISSVDLPSTPAPQQMNNPQQAVPTASNQPVPSMNLPAPQAVQ